MKKLAIGCLFILAFSNLAIGMLLYTPLDKSVKESDLIVTGTLQSVSKKEIGVLEISKGILLIEKVISGNVQTEKGEKLKSGDMIEVQWRNSTRGGCRFEIDADSNGIWLLQLDSEGATKPLFPGAMVSESDLPNVKKELEKLNRTNQTVKLIKTWDDSQKNSPAEIPVDNNTEISFGVYPLERKINYRPIMTLLVVLGSISLYYLLYRSRFKIR